MDFKILLIIGIVIACCNAGHHKGKRKNKQINEDNHRNMKKAFKHCINYRKAAPTSTEDCMKHHDHSMAKFSIPNEDKLKELKCFHAEYKECSVNGGDKCFMQTIKKVRQANQNKDKLGVFLKKWIGSLPIMIKSSLRKLWACTIRKTCQGTTESRANKFEYIQLQICAYQISHCKENNIDDETCKKNFQECLNPSTCEKSVTYTQLSNCNEENTTEGIISCMLDLKDPYLPTRHCREKICYDRANAASNFGETYQSCMEVNKMKKMKRKQKKENKRKN